MFTLSPQSVERQRSRFIPAKVSRSALNSIMIVLTTPIISCFVRSQMTSSCCSRAISRCAMSSVSKMQTSS